MIHSELLDLVFFDRHLARRHGTPVPDSFSVLAEEASVYQKFSTLSTRRFLRGTPSWSKRHLIDPASVWYGGFSQRAVGYRAGPFVGLKEEKIGYEDLWCRRCSVEILSRCNQFGSNLVDMRLAVGGRHL